MRNAVITLILITIMVLNALDVVVDIGLGVPFWHIVQESMLVVLSAIGAALLIFHMHKKNKSLKYLALDLADANKQISLLNGKIQEERKRYSLVIKEQFEHWGLTTGEQQVAILLLKGLSFKEISTVRETKEMTVRQQASSIYSKSGLVGRHEFSAWFLEDFLS
ncbi:helix-turn-helix transcriptional regulator [Glaciecola sp. MF2-115]|uniref:helix-turn-helix transcriptional regulator n=1 Tax=Glaciecola sp. MF2-115 TaxID=3384827 RepID=UPI0039A34F7E